MLRTSIISNAANKAAARFVGRSAPIWSTRVAMVSPVRHNSTNDSIQSTLPTAMDSVTTLPDSSQAIGEASNHIGYLQDIGLAQSWWWPPDLIQHCLEIVHVYTGMPWWGTICATTILVRLVMFPLYAKSSDTMARNSRIKPELDELNQQLMSSTDTSTTQLVALKRKKLLAAHGIKNRWLAAPMLQLPIALGFFSGLRHMANFPVDGFTNQGTLWFQDLTLADPYLGLQVITAGILISFTRLGGETGAQQFSPVMRRVFTILPLISIPATMNLSSAVVLYFAINGSFSVLQTLVLRNQWVRHKLKIADVVIRPPSELGPQKGIIQAFKDNMAKAREQAEKRQLMNEREQQLQERARELKKNANIKIVRRSDIKKR